MKATWTITFSECVENHAGMQKVGTEAERGFSGEDLERFGKYFSDNDLKVEMIDLKDCLPEEYRKDIDAKVLVVRGGLKFLLGKSYEKGLKEIKGTSKLVDTKAWMRGRVVNKIARYNLCYGEEAQVANYEEKKGTIVAFSDAKYVNKIRRRLGKVDSKKCKGLLAELNYYYDNSKCYIGWHGDSERKKVIGIRVGETMDLKYNWFINGEAIGEKKVLLLNEGDIYFMSEKASGNDWKKRKIVTLRHAAGSEKYTAIKIKKEKNK